MGTVLHKQLTVPQPDKFPTFHYSIQKQVATVLSPFAEHTVLLTFAGVITRSRTHCYYPSENTMCYYPLQVLLPLA